MGFVGELIHSVMQRDRLWISNFAVLNIEVPITWISKGSPMGKKILIFDWVVVSNIFYFHPKPWGNDPI